MKQNRNISKREGGFILPILLLITGLVSSLALWLAAPHKSKEIQEDNSHKVINEGMTLEAERAEPPFAAIADLIDSNEDTRFDPIELNAPVANYSLGASPALATLGEKISKKIIADNKETAHSTPPRSEIAPPTKMQIISTKELGLTKDQILAQLAAPIVYTSPAPAPVEPETPEAPVAFVPDGSQQNIVRGYVELQKGLALLMETDRLYVYREYQGRMIEQAAVSTREASFEIFIDQPVGDLFAELRTGHGHLLGRGRFQLAHLPKTTKYHGDVKILIDPLVAGLKGRVLSALNPREEDEKKPVVAARVTLAESPIEMVTMRDGRFSEPNLAEGSILLAKAEQRQHWGTIAPVCTPEEKDLRIYKDSAMLELTKLEAGSENKSVILGRVTKAGQPLPGAQVELATSAIGYKIIYFNTAGVPDPTLQATSNSGLYAVINLEGGIHTISARLDSIPTQPLVVVSDVKQVSPAHIEIDESRRADVRLYDAFRTGDPLRGLVRHYGSQVPAFTVGRSGRAVMNYASSDQWLVVEAESSHHYLRSRLLASRDQQVLYFPMIPQTWLSQIQGEMRINTNLHAGTVIGFVQGYQKYQVIMDENGLSRTTRVAYFDASGRVTNAKHGQPGGGFIIFNIPEGLRTIAVQPENSQRYYMTGVLVDSSAISIINHGIR